MRKSKSIDLIAVLAARLAQLQSKHPVARIAVALSGGRDSIALLHGLSTLRASFGKSVGKSASTFALAAFTVDHQLQAQSAQWIAFCRDYCQQEAIDFLSRSVDVVDSAKHGVEAAARTARYAALIDMASQWGAGCLALGHHSDDQAETVLLQLMRGTGLAGLAGMPVIALRESIVWWRPLLLEINRHTIDEYVRTHALRFVDDSSNLQTQIRRNALRLNWLPQLEQQFPGAIKNLVQLSQEAGLQLALEQDRAQQLLSDCIDASVPLNAQSLPVNCLRLVPLRLLSVADQALVLRAWLKHLNLRMPTRARLEQLRQQLLSNGHPQLKHDGWCFTLSANRQFACAAQGSDSPLIPLAASALRAVRWRAAQPDELGVSAALVDSGALTLLPRQGGEQIKLHAARPTRSIKQWSQELHIGLDQRAAMQVIWHGDDVVWVSSLGLDCRYANRDGARWVPYLAQPNPTQ